MTIIDKQAAGPWTQEQDLVYSGEAIARLPAYVESGRPWPGNISQFGIQKLHNAEHYAAIEKASSSMSRLYLYMVKLERAM
jgi:hypothetical protein